MGSHRNFLLHDLFFSSPSPSSCPFLDFDFPSSFPASSFPDLDLFLPPAPPLDPTPFLLRDLTDRVAALELAAAARRPEPATRKYTYVTEAAGRKVKWTAVDRPRRGERDLKWKAEIKSPNEDGFDREWKWESKAGSGSSARKLKWGAAVKGKGYLQPLSRSYTWEEDYATSDTDNDQEEEEKTKVTQDNKKKKKCSPASTAIKIEEIPDDNDAGCVAIRKAFAKGNGKGKKKELTPQDAALLIQRTYRAHLAHRSQVLRCLRQLAVAKAKLKEIRSMFYNISYRHRIAHDHEERQRFTEKIIVLLLTVDALEGPDYMVRTAKKSMLEELEAMLEVVDPQPPGKQRSLSRRKFDLPEGGPISDHKKVAVNNVIRIIDEGK